MLIIESHYTYKYCIGKCSSDYCFYYILSAEGTLHDVEYVWVCRILERCRHFVRQSVIAIGQYVCPNMRG